jgi:nicotinamide-nucleotide amidase
MSDISELTAEIISIGTELLLGEITDTNASWIAGQLPALGITLYRVEEVGDNRARLEATIRDAWQRANLLILTGGLGPTEDDLTREAIAGVLGERMEVVPELEVELRAFFARRGRQMPATNVKQATLIPSASVLANPIGTAPGWWVARDGRYIATMPGVPVEMKRMWRDQVTPRLLELPRGGAIISRTLKILGIGESAVEERLGRLVRSTNPTVATYAKNDGIHVRLAARAREREEALALLDQMEGKVRALFGESIYGVDDESLAAGTARLLERLGVRLAVGEAGLGGALCGAFAPETLIGGIVLPAEPGNDQRGAEVQARALASRAAGVFDAGDALGVCAVLGGGDLMWLAAALTHRGSWRVRSEEHRTDPADAPRRAMLLGLQLVREELQGLSGPFAR